MKKLFLMFLSALLLCATTPMLVSCGNDDPISQGGDSGESEGGEDNNGSENNGEVGGGTGDVPVTSIEQKKQLEKTGIALLEKINAQDFSYLTELMEYVDNVYVYEYDSEDVEDWFADCLESITKYLGTEDSGYNGYWIEIISNYERLYAASNFTGRFVAKDGAWKYYDDVDDLQFHFADANREKCVIKLATSGKTKKIYLGDSDEYDDYDYTNGVYIYYLSNYMNYMELPEHLELTLERSGKVIVRVSLYTNLNMAGEDFNLEKDSYSVSLTANIMGYELSFDKLAYTANRGAEVKFSIAKSGEMLVKMEVAADGSANNDGIETVEKATVNVDILREVQLKGVCADVYSFVNKIDGAFEAEYESEFKSYVAEANDMLNLGLYYFNGRERMADMKLMPFVSSGYYETEYWVEPVIYFADGTSYSTFDVFFDETDFRNLIDVFYSLIEDFESITDSEYYN